MDSVQAIGKIENWFVLSPDLDYYTFSSHKFGALKGVGFTLIKKTAPYEGIIEGGSQQKGMRSGTENPMGVISTELAIKDVLDNFRPCELKKSRDLFEETLKEIFGDKAKIVGNISPQRNLNTSFFIIEGQKADVLLASLDLAGFDIGKGSACSSGLAVPNKIALALGFSESESRNVIRVSLSPFTDSREMQSYIEKIRPILKKFSSF